MCCGIIALLLFLIFCSVTVTSEAGLQFLEASALSDVSMGKDL